MNILLTADVSIQDVIGGAERVLREQSVRLARDHNVYILTRRLSSHASDHGIFDDVHEYRYSIDDRNPLSSLCSLLTNAQKTYRELSSKIKFDVINFHQPLTAFAVNKLPETRNIKKIYTCHSLAFEEYASRHPKQNAALLAPNVWVRKSMEKFSLEQCEKIIVLSQYTKDKLINSHQIPGEKIVIIPGAVDIDHFRPAADKNSARAQLGIPENRFTLFTVRNLVPRMGLDNLVKAMSLLKKKDSGIHLILGGDGILKEPLKNLIKEVELEDRVTLCGFLPKDSLLTHYQAADLFVLPTAQLEGFGLVTVEAMACGTPVLATPVGGNVEILSRFDKSNLFADTSPEAMADLIFEKYSLYKNNPDAYKRQSLAARAFTENNYSWEKNVRNLEQLLTTGTTNTR